MFQVFWVASDSDKSLPAGEERHGGDACLISAAGDGEVVGDPFMHVVGVLD